MFGVDSKCEAFTTSFAWLLAWKFKENCTCIPGPHIGKTLRNLHLQYANDLIAMVSMCKRAEFCFWAGDASGFCVDGEDMSLCVLGLKFSASFLCQKQVLSRLVNSRRFLSHCVFSQHSSRFHGCLQFGMTPLHLLSAKHLASKGCRVWNWFETSWMNRSGSSRSPTIGIMMSVSSAASKNMSNVNMMYHISP